MAEERTYTIITTLTNDHSTLQVGEPILRLKQWRVFRRVFHDWLEKEVELETVVQVMRYQRSAAQNRYMWGVIVPTVQAFIKETTGEQKDKDTVYVYINTEVLGQEVKVENILGKEILVMTGKRFSQMNTKEFAEAVDKIIAHFDALSCFIQLPKGDKSSNVLNDFIEDD